MSGPGTQGAAVECLGLSRWFGDRPALINLSFLLAAGSRLAVLGANGAGKSTLLRIIATLLAPSAGTVRVGDVSIEEDEAVRHMIGFLGHEPGLYLDLTVAENLRFFARLYGLPRNSGRIDELVEAAGLWRRRHDSVRSLSRGLRQRAGLCRALLAGSSVLLLDEPDTGLDEEARGFAEEVLRRPGRTVLFATHNRDWALSMADEALTLERGRRAAWTGTEVAAAEELLGAKA